MIKIIGIVILIFMFSCRAIYYKHNEQFETVERLLSRDSITLQELKELGFIDLDNAVDFIEDTADSYERNVIDNLNKCYLQNYTIENYGNITTTRNGAVKKYFSIRVRSKTCQSLQGLEFLFYKNSNKIHTIVFYPSIL